MLIHDFPVALTKIGVDPGDKQECWKTSKQIER